MLQEVNNGNTVAVTCYDKAQLNYACFLYLQVSRKIHFTEPITELWTNLRHQKKQTIYNVFLKPVYVTYYFDGIRFNCKHLNQNFFSYFTFLLENEIRFTVTSKCIALKEAKTKLLKGEKNEDCMNPCFCLSNLLPCVQDSFTVLVFLALPYISTTTILGA